DQSQDMGVLQIGDGLDLAEEALRPDDRGEFGAQHFDRYLAVVLEIVGQVDRRHTALTELPLEAIAIGQGGYQRFRDGSHRGTKMGSQVIIRYSYARVEARSHCSCSASRFLNAASASSMYFR